MSLDAADFSMLANLEGMVEQADAGEIEFSLSVTDDALLPLLSTPVTTRVRQQRECRSCGRRGHDSRTCMEELVLTQSPPSASSADLSGNDENQQDLLALRREVRELRVLYSDLRTEFDMSQQSMIQIRLAKAKPAFKQVLLIGDQPFFNRFPYVPSTVGNTVLEQLRDVIRSLPESKKAKLDLFLLPSHEQHLVRIIHVKLGEVRKEVFSLFQTSLETVMSIRQIGTHDQAKIHALTLRGLVTLDTGGATAKRARGTEEVIPKFPTFLAIGFLTLLEYEAVEESVRDSLTVSGQKLFSVHTQSQEVFAFLLLRLALIQTDVLSPKVYCHYKTWLATLKALPVLSRTYQARINSNFQRRLTINLPV